MKQNDACAVALHEDSRPLTLTWVSIVVLVLVQLLVIQGLPGVGR